MFWEWWYVASARTNDSWVYTAPFDLNLTCFALLSLWLFNWIIASSYIWIQFSVSSATCFVQYTEGQLANH
jgi:hypothetical protein